MEGDLDRLVDRLRHLGPGGWGKARGPVQRLLRELAALGDALEPHDVPHLPDHALADAVSVLGWDAVEAAQRSADPQRAAAVGEALRRCLEATA